MCRITGFLDHSNKAPSYNQEEVLIAMRDTMSQGGPDNAGLYIDENICLGHRRLSILDLSSAGNQPMHLEEEVIIYNGEIYNFKEIVTRLEAEGVSFSTTTDTEIILKAFKQWGHKAIDLFRGMFAFAIWNKQSKKLTLVRDRVGVKPLFFYQKDGLTMFASELKAFHKHPNFDKSINPQAVHQYLQKGYISSPLCIYKYVEKVKPGCFYELQLDLLTKKTYWSIQDVYNDSSVLTDDENSITEQLESKLTESFQLRMVSDVPVGLFLSGGLDSSLVTAILQKQSSTSLKTFTIGFENKLLNEAEHAAAISNHLGTDHHELYCKEEDLKDQIDSLPEYFDEPLGTPSAIPTFLVAKLAKQEVKVSLSADGGDELFGGYSKYEAAYRYYPYVSKLPKFIKKLIYNSSKNIDSNKLDAVFSGLPVFNNYSNVGNKILKLRNAMMAPNLNSFFETSSSSIQDEAIEKLLSESTTIGQSKTENYKKNQLISYLGVLDIQTYLEGEIMTKVDRATMHNSLEGREPFLDHHLIEFAMSIPDNLKIRNGQTKYLIRKILNKHIPKSITDRPKQGFVVPIYSLLQNHLQETIYTMVDDKDFFQSLYLKQDPIKKMIGDFFNQNDAVNPYFVWHLFVLYQWYRRWIA